MCYFQTLFESHMISDSKVSVGNGKNPPMIAIRDRRDLKNKIHILPCLLVLGLVSFLPAPSIACGTVAKSFSAVMLETDRESLEAILSSHSCSEPATYSPDDADEFIALVLLHAVQAEVPAEAIEPVFARYHCIAKLARYPAHRDIVAYLGESRVKELCPNEQLRRVYVVVSDGGANLREGPSLDAAKIGAVAEGASVEQGTVEGDWIHVKTYLGRGYMHVSTLRPYMHESIEW